MLFAHRLARIGRRHHTHSNRLQSRHHRCAIPRPGLLDTATPGTGLANLRERLLAFYGNEARLELAENVPHGVLATISFQG